MLSLYLIVIYTQLSYEDKSDPSTWNFSIKNILQATHDFSQGAIADQCPKGTGPPGAAADATHGRQNAVQDYVDGLINQQMMALQQTQQDQHITNIVQPAVQAHKTNGAGWTVINNAIQYSSLTPMNQQKSK